MILRPSDRLTFKKKKTYKLGTHAITNTLRHIHSLHNIEMNSKMKKIKFFYKILSVLPCFLKHVYNEFSNPYSGLDKYF